MEFKCAVNANVSGHPGDRKNLKDSITKAAGVITGLQTRETICKPWVIEEMLETMGKRRKWKNVHVKKSLGNT